MRDHPRPCGEKIRAQICFNLRTGSPPPMRGKDCLHHLCVPPSGITPAHAGKSECPPPRKPGRWDHPRPCGEKLSGMTTTAPLPGSPPPMRGKAITAIEQVAQCGITPAHAGKSYSPERAHLSCQDHPRPCGEKFLLVSLLYHYLGSPPPMRGKAFISSAVSRTARITPAHAGKRVANGIFWHIEEDHPRPCGEKK